MSLTRTYQGVKTLGSSTVARRGAILVSLCSMLWGSPAKAQSVGTDQPPPLHSAIDGNGINLIDGSVNFNDVQVTIGQPGSGGMVRAFFGGLGSGALYSRDSLAGTINSSGSTYTVSLGASSINFTLSGSTFTSQQGDGSTLTQTGTTYTLILRDGTTAVFSSTYAGGVGVAANVARVTTITRPSGEIDTYTYTAHTYQIVPPLWLTAIRIDAVTNNYGYEIKYLYLGNGSGTLTDLILSKIIGINNAVDYCAPTATSCTLTTTWPAITFNTSNPYVTDNLGRTTDYPGPVVASTTVHLTRPSGLTLSYTTDVSSRVITVTNGTGTWHYAYADAGTTRTTTVTDPNGHTRVVVSDTSTQLISSDTNGLSQITSYAYDSFGRVKTITYPETNFISYTYDARGNITQTQVTGKDQVSTLTTSAGYDTTCTLPAKCNKPNWTKDARGYETDFTYSGTTGQVLSVIKPLGANGLRPETDYSYTSEYAWYKNSGGTIVQASSPISLLTQVAQCATAQTCIGTINSSQSALYYGPSGAANNLLLIRLTQGSGDGSLSATTLYAYDSIGNLYTLTDPVGNATRYRYDSVRQRVGIVGPDPDGAGPLHNRAVRVTYECDGSVKAGCDGLVTLMERGTVLSQADADWTGFSQLAQVSIGYDGIDRKITQVVSSAGTYISAAQFSYDADNRTTCVATRMNPSAIGSLPASACTLGIQGLAGPDRITSYNYDNADRPLKSTEAFGTAVQADAVVKTYGANGEILTQADGRGDLTTIVRDTFNRVYQIEFPTPSNGAVSSTTDYEQYTYDANGNVTQDRRRDGTVITSGFDALNLQTGGYNGATYGYDNLGRLVSSSVGGLTKSLGYDALSELTSETGPLGTVSRQYYLDGHQKRVAYPDGYFVTYAYDATGELASITDSSSALLLQATYDNLGRRSSISRTSGPTENMAYGPDLRLSTLNYGFTDTSKNVTFGYGFNLAGQVMSAATSNTAYGWSSIGNSATTYASDGQNRYSSVGGTSLSYDGRSNLSSDGTTSYGYDGLNRLTSAGSTSLSYDATGRLEQVTGATTTHYLYDDGQIIAEYDGTSALQRRYVAAPGLDQPLIWFEGTGTASGSARWPLANAAGSIVAIGTTGSSTTTLAINTYDEYGAGGTANLGRFQYKGMPWIPEASLYHVRARTYSPKFGRFMQSDPAGYADGMNYYAYVHNDPINNSDPTGLGCLLITTTVTILGRPDNEDPPIGSDGIPQATVYGSTSTTTSTLTCDTDNFLFQPPPPPGGPGGAPSQQAQSHKRPDPRCTKRLPGNSTVTQNINFLRQLTYMSGGRGAPLVAWFMNVAPGGSWDYKLSGQPDSEMMGNFNYGATGSDFFSPTTLLSAAGIVQLLTLPSNSSGGIPFVLPPYGDEAGDQIDIQAGINAGC